MTISSQASNEEGSETIRKEYTASAVEAHSPSNEGDDIVQTAKKFAGIKNREGYFVGETHRECTNCGDVFQISSKMTLCKKCNSNRVKSQTPEWKMHQRAKMRSKLKGLDFDLELSDINIPDVCPILGIEINMNYGKSGAYKNSPSLDRIDNSKGYVKGNVWVISQLANAMKGAASDNELTKFAQWILSRQDLTNLV